MPDDVVGPVEGKVRADLEALVSSHPMGEALAEMALELARKIDAGVEDKSLAGISRELRANLVELSRLAVEADDDLSADLSKPDGEG